MSEIYDILSDALDERAPTFGTQITHLASTEPPPRGGGNTTVGPDTNHLYIRFNGAAPARGRKFMC